GHALWRLLAPCLVEVHGLVLLSGGSSVDRRHRPYCHGSRGWDLGSRRKRRISYRGIGDVGCCALCAGSPDAVGIPPTGHTGKSKQTHDASHERTYVGNSCNKKGRVRTLGVLTLPSLSCRGHVLAARGAT